MERTRSSHLVLVSEVKRYRSRQAGMRVVQKGWYSIMVSGAFPLRKLPRRMLLYRHC
jgi:hypothetical protein